MQANKLIDQLLQFIAMTIQPYSSVSSLIRQHGISSNFYVGWWSNWCGSQRSGRQCDRV